MQAQSQEANYVLEFINQTNRSIFLTGKAGTGKTTLLREIIETTHKNTVVVAPTGIAALNAGGVTIHSFFHLPFAAFVPDLKVPPILTDTVKVETRVTLKRHFLMNNTRRALMRNLELLVIDEVSMLRADVLDAIDFMLQTVRRNQQPFGGVQVLFIGDLLQLPPVVKNEEWDVLKRYYDGAYFFQAQVIQQAPPIYIELNKVYRQSDDVFINILNNLRNNRVTPQDVTLLNTYTKPNFNSIDNSGYITLTTHNAAADKINTDALKGLSAKSYKYNAELVGDFPEKIFPIEYEMELKVGAQVIFIKNDISFEKNFYNGKMGVISSLSSQEVFVRFEEENKTIEVDRYEWQNIKYTVNPNTKEIEEEVLGTFTHFPLKLAWAITVHKSQGLTFDKAIIDVSKVFLPGQAYVALSRVRSLEGLVLLAPIRMNGLESDYDVIEYAKNKADEGVLESELQLQTKMFLMKYLIDAYSWFNLSTSWHSHIHSYAAESVRSKKMKYKPWAEKSMKQIDDMLVFSEKFINQLRQLFYSEPYRFAFIKERVEKAYKYFFPQIDQLVFELLFNIAQVKREKQMKAYFEELSALEEQLVGIALQMKKALKVLQIIDEGKRVCKENLRSLDISEYKINHLVNIANLIRETSLDLGQDYEEEVFSTKEKKEKKKSTTMITLELWQEGNRIEEIADIRKLTTTTIYSHLAKLINEKSIALADVMEGKKIKALETVFKEYSDKTLAEIKGLMGTKYSWEELKLYQRTMLSESE
ncbi:MAG: helix-turn-helix domain-containing protein [Flavobacteriaceae bacterium]|jgi:hypothetical protein|nr:helix-turn-helix domain-containing protein [Flavobacteriaceae bacterium]